MESVPHTNGAAEELLAKLLLTELCATTEDPARLEDSKATEDAP
jgi:hypothetical protein